MRERLRKLEKQIQRIRDEVYKIRDMRPGSVSCQYKDPRAKAGAYHQLSYTYKMKSHTEYVPLEQMVEIKRQTAEFRRFRKLIDKWTELAIEHARLKTNIYDGRKIEMSAESKNDLKEIVIRVDLLETDPPIWRRIRMSSNMTLDHLHYAIQGSFGWTNSHLHCFAAGDERYSSNLINVDEGDDIDSCSVTLQDFLKEKLKQFIYQYDFGDSWEHQITIEGINPLDAPLLMPECTDGKLHGPPEDCGGTPGFEDFIQIMADKKHPSHKEMKTWFGGSFNPEKFSVAAANKNIKFLQKYVGTRP